MPDAPLYYLTANWNTLPLGAAFGVVYPPVSWVAQDSVQARWRVVTFRVEEVEHPPLAVYEAGARKKGENPHKPPVKVRGYVVVETTPLTVEQAWELIDRANMEDAA